MTEPTDNWRATLDAHRHTPEFAAYVTVAEIQDAICDAQADWDWTDDDVAAAASSTVDEYQAFLAADETVPLVDIMRWAQAVGLMAEVAVTG